MEEVVKLKYWQRPEVKAKKRAYEKVYSQGQEVKERKRELRKNPKRKLVSKKRRDKPENKKKKKEYSRRYNQKPEVKKRIKEYRQQPNVKLKINEYLKGYRKRPHIKAKIIKYGSRAEVKARLKKNKSKLKNKLKRNKEHKRRMKTDLDYSIKFNIRGSLYQAMRMYSKTGKVMSLKKYGISPEKVQESLGPKPKDGNIYEDDHIIPLRWFNHNDLKEIKWAWAPENHQWLRKEINMWKKDRVMLPLSINEQEQFMKDNSINPIKNN